MMTTLPEEDQDVIHGGVRSSRKNTYVSYTRSDIGTYFDDSVNVRLGFKDYDKIYMMKLPVTDDMKVKKGDLIAKDICEISGSKKLKKLL